MEQQIGRRLIAVDRPGFGLSDPVDFERPSYRQYAVDVVVNLVDALGLESADFVGSSVGNVWALWTALAQPSRVRRLALLGATPLLPGTSPPVAFRLSTTPGIGELLDKLMPELSSDLVVKMITHGMGEGDSIVHYPGLIDVFIAAGSDPIAKAATRNEQKAIIRGLRGWRPELTCREEELGGLQQPVLLIWGDHDPIGDIDAAHRIKEAIPHARLQVLPTGHAPWWGEPYRSAELISEWLRD